MCTEPDTASPEPRRRRRRNRASDADSSPCPSPGVRTRAAALDVLTGVLCEGHSLTRCLETRSALPDRRDDALVKEICFGVLRRRSSLEHVLTALLRRRLGADDFDVEIALLIGLYQLVFTRVSPHAAVSTSAALGRHLSKPWATSLLNGVLRTFLRRRAEFAAGIAHAGRPERSHPRWLVDAVRRAWPERWRDILRANDGHPPMTLRVNAARLGREDYLERLRESAQEARPAPHCEEGIVLARPREVSELPGFLSGEVSVQDAAAQLAAPLLDPAPGARVLDACAAPGGKAAHLLERRPSLHLTAIDIDRDRTTRIESTFVRLGLSACARSADAGEPGEWWDGRHFGHILLDAPCSATGAIRRHPDLRWLRRPEDPQQLARQQSRLLASTWPLLARGGSLLYATCSILSSENDDVIARFLAAHRDARADPIHAMWGIATGYGRQILPGDDGMDGFYYALLVKT